MPTIAIVTYIVGDQCQSGVVDVEPGRDLSISDYVDVSHPRRILLYGAQRVTHLLWAGQRSQSYRSGQRSHRSGQWSQFTVIAFIR